MQDLLLLLATITFLSTGIMVPFVLALGYVWVDVFSPHQISASLLTNQPVAFIMGAAAFGIYLIKDRQFRPKFTALTAIQLLLGVWITLTTQWALVPVAEARWDTAIKVLLFSVFLPYVIRTRVQIEAFLIVYLFSIEAHILPWGLKTLLSGGGYNMNLGQATTGTFLLQESSTVSGICVMVVPLLLALRQDSILLPAGRLRDLGILFLVVMGPIAAIGTFARTALIAFGVTGTFMWIRSRRKVLTLVGVAILAAAAYAVTSDKWASRISTINDYENESSAYVRLLVWRWGLDFVGSHPFGGGFWVWMTNRIEMPTVPGQPPNFQTARAFHNVFVALLAEHGFIGFGLYVAMLGGALVALQKAQRLTRNLPEHAWCANLAKAVQVSILTIYAAGMFVEIGWSAVLLYLVSMSVCLREYARRVSAPALTLAEQHRMQVREPVQSPAQNPGTILPGTPLPGRAGAGVAGMPMPGMPVPGMPGRPAGGPGSPAFGGRVATSFAPSPLRKR